MEADAHGLGQSICPNIPFPYLLTLRCVALVTRDPSLYGEIAATLRERRIPCVSLLPGQRIPERVAVVLTTPSEVKQVNHPHVLSVPEGGDRAALWAAVGHALHAKDLDAEIVVGIDPGPRPGYAVLSGNAVIGEGVLESPEAMVEFANHLRHRFPSRSIRHRVGSGDPVRCNRIVNGLLAHRRSVELVDEQGTTPRGHRRPRDMLAARQIAATAGRAVVFPLSVQVTEGEVANVQRLSRIGSDGRLTIPRAVAHRVLQGEMTLSEAVASAISTSNARRAGSRSEPPAQREWI